MSLGGWGGGDVLKGGNVKEKGRKKKHKGK
jgi:hypothetical protein